MNVKERIKFFVESQDLNVSTFEKTIKASNGYVNSISKSIGLEKLESILENFPKLNIEWLLTGKGEMLKKDNNTQLPTAIPVSTPNGIPLLPNNAFAGIGDEYMESVILSIAVAMWLPAS